MKTNVFSVVASIFIAALLAYMLYAICEGNENTTKITTMCVSGFVFLFIVFMGLFGMSYPNHKVAVNVRAMSTIVLILLLIIYIPMAIFMYNIALMIVPAGILMVIYLVSIKSIVDNHE